MLVVYVIFFAALVSWFLYTEIFSKSFLSFELKPNRICFKKALLIFIYCFCNILFFQRALTFSLDTPSYSWGYTDKASWMLIVFHLIINYYVISKRSKLLIVCFSIIALAYFSFESFVSVGWSVDENLKSTKHLLYEISPEQVKLLIESAIFSLICSVGIIVVSKLKHNVARNVTGLTFCLIALTESYLFSVLTYIKLDPHNTNYLSSSRLGGNLMEYLVFGPLIYLFFNIWLIPVLVYLFISGILIFLFVTKEESNTFPLFKFKMNE